MRLRYLHIRNYPPLEDVALCFRKPVLPERECAIRFVVGVNGSGKTHLLQAVAETFLALARQQRPHFPITLAWELGEGERRRTLVFHNPGRHGDEGWWQEEKSIPDMADEETWDKLLAELQTGQSGWEALIREGNWPSKGVGLPKAVLAHTTGCLDPWQWLFHHEPPASDIDIASQADDYDNSGERPAGWSREQELDYQAIQSTEESRAEVARIRKLAEEFSIKEQEQETCLLLDPVLLKFALLAVSLRRAMQDYRQYPTDEAIQIFMQEIRDNPDKEPGLRRLLSQAGWVWPVSLILQLEFNPDAWGEREATQKRRLLQRLYHLSNEVVRDPDPSTQRRLFFDLRAKAPSVPASVRHERAKEKYFSGADAFEYVGDALLQFLGGPDSSPFDGFRRLIELRRQGLLTDIQIAVRKADVDDILMFDELSDGEQVYLGRIALFHLLQGESDALLLLDEPEVHFNDKWKREIVDIIDNVLKERANDVLIATHSSITLTDVFNDEIILFDKHEGRSVPVDVRSTTFGADPSEVMIRLFGVPDSMGERALEWLDAQLDRRWTTNDVTELEVLLERIGPGFHRAELRGILKRLKENVAQD